MGRPMAAQLGRVLYWAGCLFAGLWVAGGTYTLLNTGYSSLLNITVLTIDAAGIWVIGYGCRYLLAGEWKPTK